MTFIDHLKGVKTDDLLREFAVGIHVVAGDLTKSIVTGSSPTHVVTVQHILADTFGKGWSGPIGVWFRGVNRASTKYRFYPGIHVPDPTVKNYTVDHTTDTFILTAHGYLNGDMLIFLPGNIPPEITAGVIYFVVNKTTNDWQVSLTSGGSAVALTANGSGTRQVYKNDASQGIDTVFNLDTPHSNTAWIRCECPNGSETGIPDFDTKNNPPIGLSGIYKTQLGDIYDSSGTVTSSNQFITNPGDVIAFGCKEIRRYANTRIGWALLDTLRSFCDATVTPDYTTLPVGVGLTGSYYDGSAFNTLKSKRWDPVIQYDLSTGAPALDITPTGFSVRHEGFIRFKYSETYTLYLTHNDSGKCWVHTLTGGSELINQASAGTHSATFAATADLFEPIKLEWTNAAGDSQFMLEWQSTSQPRQVVPQDRLYPKNEDIKRFETHVAFTQRATFDEFLRSVLFTCNGTFQDIDGKLTFFSIDNTTASFNFDETNIVKDTFKFYPRFTQQELFNLPNRFVADGRDLMSRYLEKFDPPLYYDLPDLQDVAGRVIEETVVLGNTNRWQGLTNLAHYAHLRTAPMVCEFEGMPQTLAVMQGDRTTVTKADFGVNGDEYLVVEATDKSIDKDADNRIFKCLFWNGAAPTDAAAFLVAAGISDTTISNAITQLVADLKTAGIWSKMYAIYPFVGGSAAAHKFNLKDPRDLDAAYRLTFNGSFTHNSNGITPGGTSSDYADTHINGSTVLSKTDMHYSFYSRTNVDALACDFGADGELEVLTRYFDVYYQDVTGNTERIAPANTDSRGFFCGTCGGSGTAAYKNGTSIGTHATATTNFTNNNVMFCTGFTGLARPSTRNLAFGSVGTALTSGEVAAFYTAVQAFQTALSRNV